MHNSNSERGSLLIGALIFVAVVGAVTYAMTTRLTANVAETQKQQGSHVVHDLQRYVSTMMDCSKTTAALPATCTDLNFEGSRLVGIKRERDDQESYLICNPKAPTSKCLAGRFTEFFITSGESKSSGVYYSLRARCTTSKVLIEYTRIGKTHNNEDRWERLSNSNHVIWRNLFEGEGGGCDIKS